MRLYSLLCPFWSLPISFCSAQICFPIKHFSPSPNSKSTHKSFCDFSYIQTPHNWITDVHRITSISLKVGSLKAFSYVWVLVFWYWICCADKPYRQKSRLSTSFFLFSASCLLALVHYWWLFYFIQFAQCHLQSIISQWVLEPSVFTCLQYFSSFCWHLLLIFIMSLLDWCYYFKKGM